MAENLIEIKKLCKHFNLKKSLFEKNKKILHAVDGVTLEIKKGETLGLVGESGCGKTSLGRTVVKLYEPTSGDIIYNGKNITNLNFQDMKSYRRKIQMIFQDPYASLNPRQTIGDIIKEPMEIHNLYTKEERDGKVLEILELVGLNSSHMSRYPHEFSGGQRQRVGIARALACEPEFIVCDEPISALDVSIQAQIINTLEDLQKKLGLTYLFIAHDLSMVKHISDRVGIMYLGKLVEISTSDSIYDTPLHPYTQALLSAIPIPDPDISLKKERIILEGDIPTPINPKPGCRFKSRCPKAFEKCQEIEPDLVEVKENHKVACHLYTKI
ncbi:MULTISPECIES: ABC transporter ATP-binding protein [Cetobacterium]|jgi:oligopeptide transport system ATP-binding protein|uniref:Dipeptide ABC transporter ATP-binding protein n=1 Tax=Candidatus Cetobacterium colombiensis TaxID=3073100 RepID=A0ABU4W7R0_9FUSO|nr:dipeptide ABC transporter ATP-binding protein [Candidatus Cetobacterium colombiensis]MDX8335576.1 dipeptide ABC transporter ATP-binding protein [Candidatus Cetobacterium colombiensis]